MVPLLFEPARLLRVPPLKITVKDGQAANLANNEKRFTAT